jgi:hypothetical protein
MSKAANTQRQLIAAAFTTFARCVDDSPTKAAPMVREWIEKGETYTVVSRAMTVQGLMVEVAKDGRKIMPFSNTGLLAAWRFSIVECGNN